LHSEGQSYLFLTLVNAFSVLNLRIVGKPYLTGPNWSMEGLPVNAPRETNAISEMAQAQLVKRLQ